ncbi:MAG: hypothetical protein BWX70_03374 [Verrucomicrobia bacterium ADurb.Bin070]|nr:MAG: hypothetical protein BWX70_03374 [Verrucomicrobia bacterium ADurb.Bin070]
MRSTSACSTAHCSGVFIAILSLLSCANACASCWNSACTASPTIALARPTPTSPCSTPPTWSCSARRWTIPSPSPKANAVWLYSSKRCGKRACMSSSAPPTTASTSNPCCCSPRWRKRPKPVRWPTRWPTISGPTSPSIGTRPPSDWPVRTAGPMTTFSVSENLTRSSVPPAGCRARPASASLRSSRSTWRPSACLPKRPR